jgi:hypothetical protein
MKMSEGYNPFKMLGGYIGGILAMVLLFIFGLGYYDESYNLFQTLSMNYVFSFIIGFLIGWGIHSWIRKARS